MIKQDADFRSYESKTGFRFNRNILFSANITAVKNILAGSFGTVLAFKNKFQKPFIQSQPIPEKNDGPVKIVVGNNFQEAVTDSGRDAFIEFYSPYCRHCHELEPKWNQFGEKMKNEDVDIIKIDATANTWPDPQYVVKGFPTIYWKYADNTKAPIKYTSHRTVMEFIKFTAKHATNELKGWDRRGYPKKKKS